jgi:hypothetical protein
MPACPFLARVRAALPRGRRPDFRRCLNGGHRSGTVPESHRLRDHAACGNGTRLAHGDRPGRVRAAGSEPAAGAGPSGGRVRGRVRVGRWASGRPGPGPRPRRPGPGPGPCPRRPVVQRWTNRPAARGLEARAGVDPGPIRRPCSGVRDLLVLLSLLVLRGLLLLRSLLVLLSLLLLRSLQLTAGVGPTNQVCGLLAGPHGRIRRLIGPESGSLAQNVASQAANAPWSSTRVGPGRLRARRTPDLLPPAQRAPGTGAGCRGTSAGAARARSVASCATGVATGVGRPRRPGPGASRRRERVRPRAPGAGAE